MENRNIKIETVACINFDYPYLEVFYKSSNQPFLDIGITAERQLNFKFYPNYSDIDLNIEEMDHILNSAKVFLPKALKNEDDFLDWSNSLGL